MKRNAFVERIPRPIEILNSPYVTKLQTDYDETYAHTYDIYLHTHPPPSHMFFFNDIYTNFKFCLYIHLIFIYLQIPYASKLPRFHQQANFNTFLFVGKIKKYNKHHQFIYLICYLDNLGSAKIKQLMLKRTRIWCVQQNTYLALPFVRNLRRSMHFISPAITGGNNKKNKSIKGT